MSDLFAKLGNAGVEVLSVFVGSQNSVMPVVARSMPLSVMALAPESFLSGEDLKIVLAGMEAANITDFVTYLKMALKRQARTDLGMAKRDTVADVSSLSMEELARMRKPATAADAGSPGRGRRRGLMAGRAFISVRGERAVGRCRRCYW